MGTVYKLPAKAEAYTETNIDLLDQINDMAPKLAQLLPEGQFKDELLEFVEQKKHEYIEQIMSL